MEQDYKPDFEDGVIDILSDEAKFQLANDPIYLMQHNLEGKIKTQSANERLEALIDLKDNNSKLDKANDERFTIRKRIRFVYYY